MLVKGATGIQFVESVLFKMSVIDGLDHTPNQSSYLMNYMPHKYDIDVYIMFLNNPNATNSMKLSLEMSKGWW